ncbi:Mus7/MMS22 family [Nakaseomyces glabratus]|nr:Mus7/MMS22 family [Nakaseomyces glabratus]KAH7598817.1 Mus7/MMS22 family [Nakaseomyces glabratus]KAI8400988.1 Mus7/MMS22 family [Nakaseomyces glabratus]
MSDEVVLGSETEDQEVLFQQDWLDTDVPSSQLHEPLSQAPVAGELGVRQSETAPLDASGDTNESRDQPVPAIGLRWSLRKRKAIQKMPYSLDRLKHKQLLQGYDVSNDMMSQLELPAPTAADLDTYFQLPESDSDSESDPEASIEIKDDDELGNDSLEVVVPRRYRGIRLDRSLDDDSDTDSDGDDTVNSQSNQKSSQSEIMFRGRKINLKTGFKGLLPRSVWEKNMKSQQSKPKSNTSSTSRAHKGVALRKRVANRHSSTLNDGFLIDDISEVEEEVTPLNLNSAQSHLIAEDMASSHERPPYILEDESGIDYISNNKQDVQGRYSTYMAGEILDGNKNLTRELNPAYNFDEPSLSMMLHRTSPNKSKKDNKSRAPRSNKPGSLIKRRKKEKSTYNPITKEYSMVGIKYSRRSIRRPPKEKPYNNYEANITSKKASGDLSNLQPYLKIPDVDKKDHKGDRQQKTKSRSRPYEIAPPENAIFKRNDIRSFSTVVEKIGDEIVVQHNPNSKLQVTEDAPPGLQNGFLYLRERFPAIESLFNHKAIEIPNVIKISLGNESFVLSKMDYKALKDNLTKLFTEIVNNGASDDEIFDFNVHVTSILLYLNKSDIYEIIEDFHRKFRTKLSSIYQKAKPIHFFQIVMCQLMLFEITKYADISTQYKKILQDRLSNHIVSFFNLLDICYETLKTQESLYLNEAFHIISLIISDFEDGVELIWERLGKNTYSPSLFSIIITTLPILEPQWQSVKIINSYENLKGVLKLVRYCNSYYKWKPNDLLILQLNKIFKERRFEDFPEEHMESELNHVISSPTEKIKRKTIFNKYLSILRSSNVHSSIIEKITPMSEILTTDTTSILINRVNLIIILSWFSNLNIEKRLSELLKPVLNDSYLHDRDSGTTRIVARSVLESFLALIRTTAKKNGKISLKLNIFHLFFKEYVSKHDYLVSMWISFINRTAKISANLPTRTLKSVLKYLVICFEDMQGDIETPLLSANLSLMKFMVKHLENIHMSIINSRLLSLSKQLAKTCRPWIKYYTIICDYMIQRSEMTFWTYFQYSGINFDKPNGLYFLRKALSIADDASYQIIRERLYSTLIDKLYIDESDDYYALYNTVLGRDLGIKLEFKKISGESHQLELVKRLVRTLAKLQMYPKINILVQHIISVFNKKFISENFAVNFVQFIDENYRDYLIDYQDFSILKRLLSMNDIKNERLLFKESFRKCEGRMQQMLFIQKNILSIIHKFAKDEADSASMILKDKIVQLMVSPILDCEVHFIRLMIESNIMPSDNVEIYSSSQIFISFMMDVLKGYLDSINWIIDSESFQDYYLIALKLIMAYPASLCLEGKCFFKILTFVDVLLNNYCLGLEEYSFLYQRTINAIDKNAKPQFFEVEMTNEMSKLLASIKFPINRHEDHERNDTTRLISRLRNYTCR